MNTFINIIDSHPDLTTHGFGIDEISYNSEEEKAELFQRERNELYKKEEEFNLCREYLSNLQKRSTINPKSRTSYSFKHDVQHYAKRHRLEPTYISEGAFIAAAIAEGFLMEPVPERTSVRLNISLRSKIDGEWVR